MITCTKNSLEIYHSAIQNNNVWQSLKIIGKRFFLLYCVLLFSGYNSVACDFCNCYLGLNPGYNKNTVGFRSSVRNTSLEIPGQNLRISHLGEGHPVVDGGGLVEENFLAFELFARLYPISKLQLIVNMPYNINTIDYNQQSETRSAFSDLTLMGMYQLANTMTLDSLKVRHRLFAGAGIKLPTGKYKTPEDVTIPMADHLYSGTGSFDVLFGVSYLGKYRNFGWNVDLNYKLNTKNSQDYQFGNTINLVPRVFYEYKLHSFILYPHLGVAFEQGDTDEDDGVEQTNTGGQMIFGTGGLDVYFKMISLSTDVRLPVYENMADGMPVDKSWFIASLNFHF
jgi:hypothetical protein